MKRFFYYILLVILGVTFIDIVNRFMYENVFSNIPENSALSEAHSYHCFNDSSSIVILGASRAQYHYNPYVFEKELHTSTYNLGLSGQNIFQQYLCFKRITELKKTKIVILDLSPIQLSKEWYDRSTLFNPFYWEDQSVKEILDSQFGAREHFFMLSSLYQYNSHQIQLLKYHLNYSKETSTYKGFESRPVIEDKTKLKLINGGNFDIDSLSLSYLYKIFKLAKFNNIKLIVCYSPSMINDDKFIQIVQSICNNNKIDFFDYNKLEIIRKNKMFSDTSHMDEEGASVFSRILSEQIRNLRLM